MLGAYLHVLLCVVCTQFYLSSCVFAQKTNVDNEHNPHYEKPLSMCMHLNISGRITVLCQDFLPFFRKKELNLRTDALWGIFFLYVLYFVMFECCLWQQVVEELFLHMLVGKLMLPGACNALLTNQTWANSYIPPNSSQ